MDSKPTLLGEHLTGRTMGGFLTHGRRQENWPNFPPILGFGVCKTTGGGLKDLEITGGATQPLKGPKDIPSNGSPLG